METGTHSRNNAVHATDPTDAGERPTKRLKANAFDRLTESNGTWVKPGSKTRRNALPVRKKLTQRKPLTPLPSNSLLNIGQSVVEKSSI